MTRDPEIVWLTEERTYAVLVNLGAWYSVVRYTRGGHDYEIQVSNDEFEYWNEHATEYEGDNGAD